jgi:hypothetical protein
MRIAMVHWAFPPGRRRRVASGDTLPRPCGARSRSLLADGVHRWLAGAGTCEGTSPVRTPLLDLKRLGAGHVAGQLGDAARREIAPFLASARPNLVHALNMDDCSAAHLDVLSGWCRQAGVPLVLTAHNV